MSSKKEEKIAFEKLIKAFPGNDFTLNSEYCSYRKERPIYYVTVHGVGSTIGNVTNTVDEAVELMIKMKEEEQL